VYDTIHRDRALSQLQAYGVGPRVLQLLSNHLNNQQVVPRQSGFHGPTIQPGSGNTQGSLLSPTIFNIQIDAVVRHWLHLITQDDNVVQYGMGNLAFYADDGLLGATNAEWLGSSFNILVDLFTRIGLHTNYSKTVLMACHPKLPHTNTSNTAYHQRLTGTGPTYNERKQEYVNCPDCGKSMQLRSLRAHRRRLHGIDEEDDEILRDTPLHTATSPVPYTASFPKGSRASQPCPVPQCPGRL
jgi:Reverse transcriptase (RNA-dependent DNA polymerase)